VGANHAAVHVDKFPGDGHAQAQAAVGSGGSGVGLTEAVEDVGQEFGGNALAGVGDDEACGRFAVVGVKEESNGDITARPREFDGICEEVPGDLLNTVGVDLKRRELVVKIHMETDVFDVGGRANGVDGGEDGGSEGRGLEVEAKLACDSAGDVEEVLDDLRLSLGAVVDGVEGMGDLVGLFENGAGEVGPQENRGKGRAQLMADGGQKMVLETAGFFRRFLGEAQLGFRRLARRMSVRTPVMRTGWSW
jgi:hypothetical protein